MEKHPITLVATDLDGTFLNKEKQVTDLNREMVARLKEKGILFGLCSGRPFDTLRPLIHEWGIEDSVSFVVGMNGGGLYDLRRKEKEEYHLISGEEAIEVMDFFADCPVEFYVVIGIVKFVDNSTHESRKEGMSYGAYEVETNLREFLKYRDINKLVLWFDEKDKPIIEERASQFHHENLISVYTGPCYLEYQDPRVNKGFGIRKLAKHYGTTVDNILVFGDAPNDVEMIDSAGIGVCMKNGAPECKDVADHITEFDNNHSGVGEFLKKHVFDE